jgi:hypothetical protein
MAWYGTNGHTAAIDCMKLTGGGVGCHATGAGGRWICGAHAMGRAQLVANGKIVLCMPAVEPPIMLVQELASCEEDRAWCTLRLCVCRRLHPRECGSNAYSQIVCRALARA